MTRKQELEADLAALRDQHLRAENTDKFYYSSGRATTMRDKISAKYQELEKI